MRYWARRVTPSMVIACIALGVALSGSSIAATVKDAISGKRIVKNSLPGDRVKKGTLGGSRVRPDSLTGVQVNESLLGKVPAAAAADTAADAAALGSRPASAYATLAARTIPSGTTVSGAFGLSANVGGATTVDLRQVVGLPGPRRLRPHRRDASTSPPPRRWAMPTRPAPAPPSPRPRPPARSASTCRRRSA